MMLTRSDAEERIRDFAMWMLWQHSSPLDEVQLRTHLIVTEWERNEVTVESTADRLCEHTLLKRFSNGAHASRTDNIVA